MPQLKYQFRSVHPFVTEVFAHLWHAVAWSELGGAHCTLVWEQWLHFWNVSRLISIIEERPNWRCLCFRHFKSHIELPKPAELFRDFQARDLDRQEVSDMDVPRYLIAACQQLFRRGVKQWHWRREMIVYRCLELSDTLETLHNSGLRMISATGRRESWYRFASRFCIACSRIIGKSCAYSSLPVEKTIAMMKPLLQSICFTFDLAPEDSVTFWTQRGQPLDSERPRDILRPPCGLISNSWIAPPVCLAVEGLLCSLVATRALESLGGEYPLEDVRRPNGFSTTWSSETSDK